MKIKYIKLPIRLIDLTNAGDLLHGRPDACRFRKMWRKEALARIANEAASAGVRCLWTKTRVANSYNKGYHPGYAAEVKMEFQSGEWWVTDISREAKVRCSYGSGKHWEGLPTADPLVSAVMKAVSEATTKGNA